MNTRKRQHCRLVVPPPTPQAGGGRKTCFLYSPPENHILCFSFLPHPPTSEGPTHKKREDVLFRPLTRSSPPFPTWLHPGGPCCSLSLCLFICSRSSARAPVALGGPGAEGAPRRSQSKEAGRKVERPLPTERKVSRTPTWKRRQDRKNG